jgi:hypothetical protein
VICMTTVSRDFRMTGKLNDGKSIIAWPGY